MTVRNARVVEAVDIACARAGIDRADIDHVIYINDRREAVAEIARAIGVPIERTNADFVAQHGHMGAADQMVSLAQHVQRGDLRPGEIVALCGMSIGMHWCATLLAA
jgi:3-oxoacyl-[acyl-carrier-protein] synthase-3